MMRQHTPEPLDDWLVQVQASGLAPLMAFARSVARDKAAISAGLTLPFRTGSVEGQIHKLKLIKRQAALCYLQHLMLGEGA
ncbi:MAG: transposase [Ktedonobacterales bacterium]|nr:transposase [Ktedonobacterales bacterium]